LAVARTISAENSARLSRGIRLARFVGQNGQGLVFSGNQSAV
jgi:hypothetical protein